MPIFNVPDPEILIPVTNEVAGRNYWIEPGVKLPASFGIQTESTIAEPMPAIEHVQQAAE